METGDPHPDPAGWEQLLQEHVPERALDRIVARRDAPGLDHADRALGWRATARCLLELGRTVEAREASERSIEWLGRADGTAHRVARIPVVMTAAIVSAESGDADRAEAWLVELAESVEGPDRGRALVQLAVVRMSAGKYAGAVDALDAAESALSTGGADIDRFRVLFNRGYVRLQQDLLDEADEHFRDAAAVAAGLGMTAAVAQCHANRGVLAGRARRLAEAVDHFRVAEELFGASGDPGRSVGGMQIDRAELLLHSGLGADAVAAAERAVAAVGETGNRLLIGDAVVVLARCLVAARRYSEAITMTARAHELLAGTERTALLPIAEAIRQRAELLRARTGDEVAAVLGRTEMPLELPSAAETAALAHARVTAARRAGSVALVGDDLRRLIGGDDVARRDRHLLATYGRAVAAEADGDLEHALELCDTGLRQVDELAAETSTLAERSAVLGLGDGLCTIAADIAVGLGDAALTFVVAEGTRARALHDELGSVRPHRGVDRSTGERLLAQVEDAVAAGGSFVEWVESTDRLHAFVVDAAGRRLVDVGPSGPVIGARDRLLAWMDRARERGPAASTEGFLRSGAALGDLLVGPLGLADGPVSMSTVGPLHGVAWGALPSFRSRAVTVVPSAQMWLTASGDRPAGESEVGVVVGPGLETGADDVAAVRRGVAVSRVAATPGADAAAVRSMLAECDVVHVAAHGRFQPDRPLLSTIRLDDGEVYVGDLLPDVVRARVVVLGSCDAAMHAGGPGNEVLGVASVLLAHGVGTVVAPVGLVPDRPTTDLVDEVYRRVGHGATFADALAGLRDDWIAGAALDRCVTGAAFQVFGSIDAGR